MVGATKEDMERAETEIRFWTEDFPASTSTEKLTKIPEYVDMGPDTLWEVRKDGGKIRTITTIPNSRKDLSKLLLLRVFGWQAAELPASRGAGDSSTEVFASTTAVGHSISAMCAQDIYQSFLCAITAVVDSIGGQTKGLQRSEKFCLTNDLLSRLADCFTESGLGSRQDAYLIIIPALRYLSKLPSARDALPDIYSHAGKHRKAGDFHEAEKSLKFAWEIALGTHNEHQENTGLDTAMLELGELYRYALFSKDSSQQEFGRKGIFWMQRQPQFASVAEVTNRYIELEKLKRSRPNGGPTAQSVIAAISGNNRIESLWLISQVREVLSPDNKDGRTVLSWAAQQGWPEVVKAALEIGSAIDSADKLNRTPLSYASEHGRDDVVRILMKNQALPIVEDSSRRTPLSYAAAGGFVRVMEILMNDQRVTTLAKDKDLCSPLYWAAKKGKGNATKWLLGKNAVIDDPDRNGLTPLIVALSNRQESTAEILAKEVAKFNISIEKTKAWQWAVENGEWTCAAFLLKLSNEESAKNTSNM